ncbi:assimilatory nitrate reductase (NADH) alpha subunit apoprotein [Methylomagnum ishizawai]|uniref:nitrate reductase (cytochrome) n=1 Tax=Methylomagnum ishizawai TaxID=1760988 RepID=A0A1Y6DA16_9GAMM|nr:nitrate reductase [Methylomagnum ishizawai]SMF97034.1 assimilatory nitrate reductase (NADH) alpha subunit apoprotein [Methylomagnum ishizawai]
MHATSPIRTTCPYCGVGCGVLATPTGPESALIQGDPEHPANYGRLCSKGSALGETLSLQTRLLYPQIGPRRVGWDEALDKVAGEFRRVIDTHGPEAVAFYVSGQLLTEDYYLANKLMKGYIGSANIDTNSRLCMSSTVAGQKRAFGEDVVPGCYEDLEQADLIVLVGSNAAWCHPVLFQRIVKAKQDRPGLKLVTIDPRRTATSESADLHLAIRPGSDVMLFNGLLNYLRQHDRLDFGFMEHLVGLSQALEAARDSAPSVPAVALACGVPETDLVRFYQEFARTEKTVTAWSQGVNQSSSGTDKVNAILNVHLATGRIGKPGMGPLSLTGQPNAMGGREVGGLANQLAAHLEIENPRHRAWVREFWNAPRMAEQPGLKAVELFQAIEQGRVKAVWIMATNPVVSLPDAAAVRRALAACEFVAVSDCEAETDLAAYAHVSLPAAAWGEKDGTVTNSERRISRQRAFLPLPGEAKPDGWIIAEVARRMGYAEGFDYAAPRDIFVEHARLSGLHNEGRRLFDIAGLAELDAAAYDVLPPIQWPVNAEHPAGTARLFAAGGFPGPEGKARLLPLPPQPPFNPPDLDYPLVLNTGRIRDQWHTMTRTGKAARLGHHLPEPYAELHPDDAARWEVADGALVRLESRHGSALARARITPDQQAGSVFMPMHWSDVQARRGLVNALVNPVVDPVSGEPESKHTPVRVGAYRPVWQGFLLSREALAIPGPEYRVAVRGADYWRYELAGETAPDDWRSWAESILAQEGAADWLEFADAHAGRYRCAVLRGGRLRACLFVGVGPALPSRDWLAGLFAQEDLPEMDRAALLAGRPAVAGSDPGRTVCACFGVGMNVLRSAIQSQGFTTVEQIGAALKAGTGCGSCLPELNSLLRGARS